MIQGGDGSVEVDRVPEDDGRCEKIQPRGSVALLLEGSVADLSKSVEENGPGQGVSGFALVQPGRDLAAQVGLGASPAGREFVPVCLVPSVR